MAKSTNFKNSSNKEYYRINRTVGKQLNANGELVPIRKQFYGSSKKEAEQKYSDYMIAHKNSKIDSNEPVALIIDRWISESFLISSFAEGTKAMYISAYKRIFRPSVLAGIPICNISSRDIQNLYNKSSYAYSSIKALHNLLVNFFRYAELNGLCANIMHSVTVPKKKISAKNNNDILIWTDEEIEKILKGLEGTTMKFLIVLAYHTGLRISELLALKYSDINNKLLYVNKQLSEITIENKKIHLKETKTDSSNRVIPLSNHVLKELAIHRKLHQLQMKDNHFTTDFIFTTSTGSFYYRRNVTRSLERLYKRIGVPKKHFHVYRATFATNLAKQANIEVTHALLGHSNISVTARYYVNIEAERKRESIEKITHYSIM